MQRRDGEGGRGSGRGHGACSGSGARARLGAKLYVDDTPHASRWRTCTLKMLAIEDQKGTRHTSKSCTGLRQGDLILLPPWQTPVPMRRPRRFPCAITPTNDGLRSQHHDQHQSQAEDPIKTFVLHLLLIRTETLRRWMPRSNIAQWTESDLFGLERVRRKPDPTLVEYAFSLRSFQSASSIYHSSIRLSIVGPVAVECEYT